MTSAYFSDDQSDQFLVGDLGVEPSVAGRPTDLQSAAVASAAHHPYLYHFKAR
jgi:hypothetical protein